MNNLEENKLKAQLALKLLNITHDLGVMEKDGENKHSNYKYVSYEELNARLKELLVEQKVVIVPSFEEVEESNIANIDKYGNEKTAIRTVVRATIEIIDCETGYSITKTAYGADQDYGGKSMGQAITELMKRFEFKLFHVSTVGDIDPDAKITEGSFKTTEGSFKPNGQPNSSGIAALKKFANELGVTLNQLEKLSQVYCKKTADTLTNEDKELLLQKARGSK